METREEDRKKDRENNIVATVIVLIGVASICFLLGLSFNTSALCKPLESIRRNGQNSAKLVTDDWYSRTFSIMKENNCYLIGTLTHRDTVTFNRSKDYDYLYCSQRVCLSNDYCKNVALSLENLTSEVVVN
jgi:hypothetical protein